MDLTFLHLQITMVEFKVTFARGKNTMVKFRRVRAFDTENLAKDMTIVKKDIQISGHKIKNVPVQLEDSQSEDISYLISDPIFKHLYSIIRRSTEGVEFDFDKL